MLKTTQSLFSPEHCYNIINISEIKLGIP